MILLQFEFLSRVIPFWLCDFRPFIDFFRVTCRNSMRKCQWFHILWMGLLICFDFVFILGYKIRHPISNNNFTGIVLTRWTVRYLFTRNTSSKTARLNGWSSIVRCWSGIHFFFGLESIGQKIALTWRFFFRLQKFWSLPKAPKKTKEEKKNNNSADELEKLNQMSWMFLNWPKTCGILAVTRN